MECNFFEFQIGWFLTELNWAKELVEMGYVSVFLKGVWDKKISRVKHKIWSIDRH